MERTTGFFNPRTTLGGLIALLVVLSFVPARWTSFLTALHPPLLTLVAPISAPMRSVVARLKGPERSAEMDNPRIAALSEQNAELLRDLAQSRQLVSELQRQIRELNLGRELNPTVQVRQMVASVIGFGAGLDGLLMIKAGRRDGVEESSVISLGGVQLVGRVRRIEARTAAVQIITQRGGSGVSSAQPMTGVVMLDERAFGPLCLLEPDGKGLLVGPLQEDQEDSSRPPTEITAGMVVRLSDPSWPAAGQMLMLGRVERVERSAKQALRRVVVVRPVIAMDRVSEVVVRTAEASQAAPTQTGSNDGAWGGGASGAVRP
jgi:cell shape-determining protein MreC